MSLSCVSRTMLALVLHVTVAGNVRASDVGNHWLAGPLHNQPAGIENFGFLNASAVWSPPSGGTFLVIGGAFATAGGVTVNNINGWGFCP